MKTMIIAAMIAFGINGEPAPKYLQLKAEQYKIAQESQRQYEEVQEQLKSEGDHTTYYPQETVEEDNFLSEFDKILDVNINLGDSIIVIKLDANGFHPVSRGTKAYASKIVNELLDSGYENFEFQFWSVTDEIGKVCSFTVPRGTEELDGYSIDYVIEDYWLSPVVK